MARSIKKGPYIEERLLARVRKMETESSKNVIKTWSRRSTITPELIGYTFAVHNGKKFIPVYVTENMVGLVSAGSAKLTRVNSTAPRKSSSI